MQDILPGTSIANGDLPLERRWSVRLPGARIDKELNRVLLREAKKFRLPGFRPNAKVVPPAFRREHGPRVTTMIISQLAEPSLLAKVREAELDILPSILLKDYTREGEEVEVTYQFEVRPEVPGAKLDDVTLTLPKPQLDDAAFEIIIERMRHQQAAWEEVDRPAELGDKVRFTLATGSKAQEIELTDALAPDMLATLTGVQNEAEVELDLARDGDASPAFKVKIGAVLAAELPPLDLVFAKKVIPDAESLEDFRKQIRDQVEMQSAKLARVVLSQRVIHLLDKATADFELPEQHIAATVRKRVDAILEQSHKQGHKIGPEHINMEALTATVHTETRSSLILAGYVKAHEIEASDEAMAAFIAAEAKEHANPQDFLDFVARDNDTKNAVRREVMQDGINELFCTAVTTKDDPMTLDQLNQAQQGKDPVIAPPVPPAAAPAEAAEPVAAQGGSNV